MNFKISIFSLVLTFFIVSCGKNERTSDISAVSAATSVKVLYWDNKNLGFGHVALRIDSSLREVPSTYLSFAMGNEFEVDLEKHGKNPHVVEMARRSEQELRNFYDWYLNSNYDDPYDKNYGGDYNIFSHNCAHAILNALRALNYDLVIRGNPIALTPTRVFKAASVLKN